MEKLLNENEQKNPYNFYKFGPEKEMNENNEYKVFILNQEVIKEFMDKYNENFCKPLSIGIKKVREVIDFFSAENVTDIVEELKEIELELLNIQSEQSKLHKELLNNIEYYKECLFVLKDQYWISSCKHRKKICDMDVKCAIEIQNTIKAVLIGFMKHANIASNKIDNIFKTFTKLIGL